MSLECKKCGKELSGNQTSYCSPRCSKLHLKSQYRKRRREHVNAYNRNRRKHEIGGSPCNNTTIRKHHIAFPVCAKCGTTIDLNVCHVKPRILGGVHKDNLITLCRKHHYQFDQALRGFWKS